MPESSPSPTGNTAAGRGPGGRFGKGNKAAKGNPLAQRVQKIRCELLKTSAADIKEICARLVDGAKGGDLDFIKEWLNRTIGKSTAGDVEERLARLEQMLREKL